jgi:hypothetical protein
MVLDEGGASRKLESHVGDVSFAAWGFGAGDWLGTNMQRDEKVCLRQNQDK